MLPPFISDSALWGGAGAAIVFTVFLIAAGIANIVFGIAISRWQRRVPDTLGVQILATLRGPAVLFIAICGLFLALLMLTGLNAPVYSLISHWDEWIRKAWLVTAIVEVAYVVHKLLDTLLRWYGSRIAELTETKLDDRLLPPLRRVLPLLTYSLAILMGMSVFNIPISPILAGIGIGGLAIALAVQPTLANFFAGTYVVTEGELNIDDYIELQGGPAGYVVEVGWRSTKIRTMYNNLVMIPNSRMADSIVINYYSPTPAIDVLVYCGVSYDSDLQQVEDVTRAAAQNLVDASPYAVKDSEPWFGFEEFADSNITFWVFVRAKDRLGSFFLTSDLVKAIHSRLTEEGIEINYPVRKLIYPDDNPGGGIPPMPPPV